MLRNIRIINSTTRLQLIGSFYEIYTAMHGSMNIKFIVHMLLPIIPRQKYMKWQFLSYSYKFSQIKGKKLAEFVRLLGEEGDVGSERQELRASSSTAHNKQYNES